MATETLPLKLIVDETQNQVVFVESSGDFIDMLLGFLTVPIGKIIHLTDDKSSIGSINNLYASIDSLHAQGLLTSATKSILLNPKNAAAEKLRGLIIDVYDTQSQCYYICNSRCNDKWLSYYLHTRCTCGEMMDVEVCLKERDVTYSDEHVVFVKEMSRFMISDDGVIGSVSTETMISLFGKLEIQDKNNIQEREVHVDSATILLLLKHYLFSETPFTDVFLRDRNDSHVSLQLKPKSRAEKPQITQRSTPNSKNIRIKLFVNKQEKKVLYAEAKNDFVDLLLSFLTFPLGFVVKVLCGSTNLKCIDNLYKSAERLSSGNYLYDVRNDILLDPKLTLKLRLPNYPIWIEEQSFPGERYYMCRECYSNEVTTIHNSRCQCGATGKRRMSLTDPKCEADGGFVKSATYMVTDELVVTQLSSALVICNHLKRAEVDSIEVVNVEVGQTEALSLLQASFYSTSVLTDAFVSRLPDEEK